MLKSLFTRIALAAALVAGAAAISLPAEAKVNVRIWIGNGYWSGPGYYKGHYRYYMSCWEGAYMVDHSGYNNVRPIDCKPRYYLYKATRWGNRYIVRVDSRWGSIIGVTRD